MADAKLTALTAASALAAADLFYVSQSAASRKATGTQLLTLVGTTYVPLAGGATMTGALTLPAGAVGAPALMFTGAGATTGLYSPAADQISISAGGVQQFWVNAGGSYSTGNVLGLYNDTGYISLGTSLDVRIYRDTSAALAQRNGTTQQMFRLYNTYTDASNYERLTLTGVQGSGVYISTESAGTGSANLDLVLTAKGTGTVYVGATHFRVAGNKDVQAAQYTAVPFVSDLTLYAGVAKDIIFKTNTTELARLTSSGAMEFPEVTAPSAPATNSVRIYAEDNGSGKTRLMALFATGAAQQIAIEP